MSDSFFTYLRENADRVHGIMAQLETNLPEEVRESVGYAFRELLLNAVEWGGKLDPTRKVRFLAYGIAVSVLDASD